MNGNRNLPAPFGFNMMLDAQRRALETYVDLINNAGAAAHRTLQMGDINIYFPFGYGFTLNADPTTNWWSNLATSKPETERRIVTNVASYGKQLGKMMDLLIDLAETSDRVDTAELEDIKQLRAEIEEEKAR